MLKYKNFYCSVSVIIGTLFVIGGVTAASAKEGTVNELARVRDTAGFTKVLVVLAKGTEVSITGEKGAWYEIKRKDGSKAWIAKDLVDVEADASPAKGGGKAAPGKSEEAQAGKAAPEKESAARSATLKYNAKLRKLPDAKSESVKLLLGGSTVQIAETKNDWCRAKDKAGKEGWISCPLLNIVPRRESQVKSTSTTEAMEISKTSLGSVTTEDINDYWQEKVNALRKKKNLRQVKLSDKLEKTAAEWADYLGKIDKATHARPDGKSMLQWIDGKGIDFTARNSKDGWKGVYFTENIGLKLNVAPTMAGVKKAMDGVLKYFLSEGPKGVHYRSVYSPDWNSVGVSWHAEKNSNDKYKVYFVFHYGSLASKS